MTKKASKDPAFLWYPNDYVGGTMGMTFEEKGAYVDLLMMQFNRGHMGGHMVGQVLGQNMDRLWPGIKTKFVTDENGLFYNERLDKEIEKRKGFISSRYNNLSGNNQYVKKGVVVDKEVAHMGGHMTSHMEDENENNNNNNNIVIDRGVGEDVESSDYTIYMTLFNSFPFRKIKFLSEDRINKLIEILATGGDHLFGNILTKAKASSYLTGQKNGQIATFDWIFTKDNWNKIIEGFYDDNVYHPQVKKEKSSKTENTPKIDYSKIEAEENKKKRESYRQNAVKPEELDSLQNNLSNLKRLTR